MLKLGLPIFKKAATTLGKHALSDGIRLSKAVANDVMHGKPIKQSLKRRSMEAGQSLLHKTIKPKKRIIKKKITAKRTPRDIFI